MGWIVEGLLGDVPTIVVRNHQDVLPSWKQLYGLTGESAVLLHIDAHPDMNPAPYGGLALPDGYERMLDCSQFIIPAAHYDLISEAYWLNPHAEPGKMFCDIGMTDPVPGRRSLETKVMGGRIYWEDPAESPPLPLDTPLRRTHPLILDVDLDAFATKGKTNDGHSPLDGYVIRIPFVLMLLEDDFAPDLVTIAKSGGSWIPEDYIPKVGELFVETYCSFRNCVSTLPRDAFR